MDDSEYYWDWLKHEDNLFTNRNNLLLVAESMTFAAVATIQAGTGKSAHGILLAAAGLFSSKICLTHQSAGARCALSVLCLPRSQNMVH